MYVCKYILNLTNIVIQRTSVFSVSKVQEEIFAVIEYADIWAEIKLQSYILIF